MARTRAGGIALSLMVVLVAQALSGVAARLGVSAPPIMIAVILGIAVASVFDVADLAAAIDGLVARGLQAGVVLLALALPAFTRGQFPPLIAASPLLLIVVAFALAEAVGRRFGIDRRERLLLASGAAICGNSAIAAVAPVVGARRDEVSRAIAANTLVGSVALLIYPAVAGLVGLSSEQFGLIAGLAVNDTAQVAAASLAFSEAAGELALVIKVYRNLFILPVVLLIGLVVRGRAKSDPGGAVSVPRPYFVLIFAAAAGLSQTSALDSLDGGVAIELTSIISTTSRLALVWALAGIGLRTSVASLRMGGPKLTLLAGIVGVSLLPIAVWIALLST